MFVLIQVKNNSHFGSSTLCNHTSSAKHLQIIPSPDNEGQ